MNSIDSNSNLIDLLPNETFLHILSYLSPKDLGSISAVSRCWHEFAQDPSLWQTICEKNYGMDFIASMGSPHPKAAMATSIFYNKIYTHLLKPLCIDLRGKYNKLRLHGHLLIEEEIWGKVFSIFNLDSQEQITVPDFLLKTPFIKWTICNKKLAVIVQDNDNRLIYSEPPFKSKIEFENFRGRALDTLGDLVFYTSLDKMKLCAFNLKKSETTFETTLESPLKNFYASNYVCAALLENQSVLIFDEPSDFSKCFTIHFLFEERQFISSVKILSNHEWLVIVDTNNAFFNACHLATKETFYNISLPISWEKVLGIRTPNECTGLQFYQNYLFVSESFTTRVVNLSNLFIDDLSKASIHRLSNENKPLLFSEFLILTKNPVDAHKLFVIQEGKLNSLDVTKFEIHQMNVDLNLDVYSECYFNGRFLIIKDSDEIQYCDFLEPQEMTSVHHLISLKDSERKIKKIKIESI